MTVDWMVRIGKALDVPPSALMDGTTPPDISNARTLALMMADAMAQEKPAQIRAKLNDILDQQLKALGIGMTPESFVKFVAESRAMAASAPPVPETSLQPPKEKEKIAMAADDKRSGSWNKPDQEERKRPERQPDSGRDSRNLEDQGNQIRGRIPSNQKPRDKE